MNQQLRPEDIEALKMEVMRSIHCALPGIVVSYDSEHQTAVIQPAVKKASQSGEIISMPLLRDVPVFMPVTFIVSEGDYCLVVFADSDIDAWFETGITSESRSARMHDLSDGFAFVGFKSRGV